MQPNFDVSQSYSLSITLFFISSEYYFATADLNGFGIVGRGHDDADAEGVGFVGWLAIETELVAGMSFGDVGDLEAADAVLAIPVEGPKVEHMLDVFHRVDMAIDVNIVVMGINGADKLGLIAHLYATTLVDGAFLFLYNPIIDGTIVDAEDVCRLTALGIDHGPDRASVTIDLTILPHNSEVT